MGLSNLITAEWDVCVRKENAARDGLGGGRPSSAGLGEVVSGSNPLVRVANRLINLIPQIRSMTKAEDLAQLRDRLVAEVRLFERRAQDAHIPQDQIVGARYCLCTVLDEAAAQTPWGGSGDWSKHSLLVSFHNETWGGEKYFQLLSRLAQNPEKHRDLLELMYFCIALGFEGRFRVIDGGRAQLETLRQRLASILASVRGDSESALSPHWKGVAGEARGWRVVPVWVMGALCVLIGLGVYLILAHWLADRSDPVFASLAAIEVPGDRGPAFSRAGSARPQRLIGFLEPEVRAGLVEVSDEPDRSVVTLLGDGLFESGSSEIKARYKDVLLRVAVALNTVPGGVTISGYTDDVPSRSIRFPSNWHLSLARAVSVENVVARLIDDPRRLRSEGRGEADPVADNGSAAGRGRNRRVEITLLTRPSSVAQGGDAINGEVAE